MWRQVWWGGLFRDDHLFLLSFFASVCLSAPPPQASFMLSQDCGVNCRAGISMQVVPDPCLSLTARGIRWKLNRNSLSEQRTSCEVNRVRIIGLNDGAVVSLYTVWCQASCIIMYYDGSKRLCSRSCYSQCLVDNDFSNLFHIHRIHVFSGGDNWLSFGFHILPQPLSTQPLKCGNALNINNTLQWPVSN